jgi:hypothetical protein
MVDITRAMKCKGYMEDSDITWIAEQASKHGRIVELGSYQGRSTRAMCDNTKGFVLAIDDWWGPRSITESEVERSKIFGFFYLNLEDHLVSGKCKYLTANHTQEFTLDFEPDMVFIDGNHEYDNVRYDIIQWSKKLAKGGLLCGHDANYRGVKKALNELCYWHTVPNAWMWVMDGMKQ